jgi:cytochrome c oxidase accessory protein FixG
MSTAPSQIDNTPPLRFFAKRERIYPKRVSGRFRNLKWLAMAVTLSIYYLAPFLRWDRGPEAPDQAILIDLTRARAYWFFIEIWPQEIYLLTGVLILAAVALFFITSLFGRVWCGYFCPQTVWTDLFIWVERLVQGDRVTRKKLTEGPFTFEKLWKKTLTHLIWILIGLCTAGAFVFYFNDAPTLWADLLKGQASQTVLLFMAGLTFSTYLMAGFAREQVCFYMCPYARFQSAMFDRDTLIIGYDTARGEPRGHHKKGESWEGRGHCIDCTACVQVCPTGIDIRKGLQMECIACGLCVDACDGIMEKLNLPKGLIRYDSENGLDSQHKARLLRPRTAYYAVILALVGGVMLYTLLHRTTLELNVLHDRNPLFVRLSTGDIRNSYEIRILNKTHEDKNFALDVSGVQQARLEVRGAGQISAAYLPVPADGIGHFHAFVTAPPHALDKQEMTFIIKDLENDTTAHQGSIFISH